MIVVSFEEEMREAFAAGQAAALALAWKGRLGVTDEFYERTPKTFEEWIASMADRPAVVRG